MMRLFRMGPLVSVCVLLLAFDGAARAQDEAADAEAVVVAEAAVAEDAGTPLTEDELEVIVAPFALYPDDLVALVIAGSLYPLQIVQAARFLEQAEDNPDLEPSEDWDGSVISLLNYPDIINMMNDDLDWTQQLGDLAVNQQKDLLVAIQQLRDQAVATGILETNEQTVVVQDNDNIIIQSPDPEVIYVPTYPPQMLYDPTYVMPLAPIVYSNPYPSYYYPSARFWTGFVTGAAFAAVVDWNSWGTWGGNTDVKIKVDGNTINFNGGDKNFDMKNIDRSRVSIGDTNINRTDVKNSLKKNDFNNVAVKGNSKTTTRNNITQKAQGKDVRRNVEANLKGGDGARPQLKKPPAVNRPAAKPGNTPKRPAAKPGNVPKRPAAGAGDKAKAAAAKRPSTTKKISAPKPGARADKRPAKPPVMGDRGKGKTTSINSNRGNKSRGGGVKGGGKRGGRR